MRMVRPWALGALTAATIALAGCGSGPGAPSDRPVRIVAGFYPLQYVAEQVGGDRATVSSLTQPGAEPHDLELSPRQVATIVDANLVVYLRGFQPAVDEAVALEAKHSSLDVGTSVPLLDAAEEGHQHDPAEDAAPSALDDEPATTTDPHLWLDPTRLATVGKALANRLAEVDPEGAAGYHARAAELTTKLTRLDHEYRTGLARCERREIVVSHAAFGYLAERYDLDQVALSISPEGEPTPQRLAEVAHEAREHDATTIFFESLVSPRVAQAIAGEVGAATAVLDPIEGPPDGSDYLGAMRANLHVLKPALGCAT